MGNKERILETVSEYFWLDNSSMNKFEKKLYEPDIDPVYAQLLGEDNRARWKLPEGIMEDIDKGWEIFKNRFKVFIHDNDVRYEDFRKNKKEVNKNLIKLRKLLKEYYLENYKKPLVRDLDLNLFSTIDDSNKERVIDSYISDVYHDIGTRKLPSSGIDVVLSLNYEDWFFCSSGENWSSCLSIESEYMYWAGLAGLIGDKNRAMIYVTDNRKKSPLDGTSVDRILSRSWLLLDQEDRINFVKFYPNEYLSTYDLNQITGLDFKSRWNRFISKHPIDPIYFQNGNSSYIYQDTTKFNSNQYLIGDHKGMFFFNKNSTDIVDSGDLFRHAENGLMDLIERREDLGSEEIEFSICEDCGRTIDDHDDEFEVSGGRIVCNICFEENYFTCDDCGETFEISQMISINDDMGHVCSMCYDDNYFTCGICENVHSTDEMNYTKEKDGSRKVICDECLDESDYQQCIKCGDFKHESEIKIDEYEGYYCVSCIKEMIDRKQNLLFEELSA